MSFKSLEGQTVYWIRRLRKYNFIPSTVKARNTTMPMPFHDDHAKRSVPTATKSMCGHTSSRYGLTAVAGPGWNPTSLRVEQLNDQDIGPILEDVET
jgi:hypothetical protein